MSDIFDFGIESLGIDPLPTTADEIMGALFISSEYAQSRRKNIFRSINRRANTLKQIISNIDYISNYAEAQELFPTMIFESAQKAVIDWIPKIIVADVLSACLESVEYNYELYITRLVNAIHKHAFEIVTVEFDNKTESIMVNVDFFVLGYPEEWLQAAEMTRQVLKIGAGSDMEKMSELWKTQIYQPAREGSRVTRKNKKKEETDITEKYKNAYQDTIETRLSFIDEDKAPFWYFIEHGNRGGGGGTPYPVLEPIHFINDIKQHIESYYSSIYQKMKSSVGLIMSKMLYGELDTASQGLSQSFQDMPELINKLETNIDNILSNAESILMGDSGFKGINKKKVKANIDKEVSKGRQSRKKPSK